MNTSTRFKNRVRPASIQNAFMLTKSYPFRTSLFIMLFVSVGLIPVRVMAQTFTVLHSFSARPFTTNYDGTYPAGRLIANASGSILYGTANLGGSRGFGTVFAVNIDGTGLTNLHSFDYF